MKLCSSPRNWEGTKRGLERAAEIKTTGDAVSCSLWINKTAKSPGRLPYMKRSGMLIRKFELNP